MSGDDEGPQRTGGATEHKKTSPDQFRVMNNNLSCLHIIICIIMLYEYIYYVVQIISFA